MGKEHGVNSKGGAAHSTPPVKRRRIHQEEKERSGSKEELIEKVKTCIGPRGISCSIIIISSPVR